MRPLHLTIVAGLLLAGCGGGGGGSHATPLTPAVAAATPAVLPAIAGAPKTGAGFSLTLRTIKPKANAKARKPQFVAAGTNAIVFSVTPSGGSTTSASYDTSTGNTLNQGASPSLTQPCVYDGAANSERVCTFYIAATPGVNHFVAQSYADVPNGTEVAVGTTNPDPTITNGTLTPVTIALDPIIFPFEFWDTFGAPFNIPYDDGIAARIPLNITSSDFTGADFPTTVTDPFVNDVASLVSGTPPTQAITVALVGSVNNFGFDVGGGCPSAPYNGVDLQQASPAALYNSAACYLGGNNASNQSFVYIIINNGTEASANLIPIDISSTPFIGTGAMTISVAAQFAAGTNLGVDSTTSPDTCPSSVATISAGPYPFDNNNPANASLTITPAPGVANGAVCELGFNVLGLTLHRIYTYGQTTGSFTVTIP